MSDNKVKGFNKGRYMAVITAVTVCCVFLGSLVHLGGMLWRIPMWRTAPGEGTVSGSETISRFDKADLTLDIGSLTIKRGSDYELNFEGYPQSRTPVIERKGDTLVVTQKMGIGARNGFPGNCHVTLTIPEDASPDLDIRLAMGGLEVSGLTLGEVMLDLDMGSLRMKDCTMAGCETDADMGACTFSGCSMADITVDADMGKITLTDCSFEDGIFTADMGDIELKDSQFATADCDADMGSIEVDGTFRLLTADCDMGSIRVTAEQEDASMDLKSDMGKITVNGENRGNKYQNY